MKMQCNVGAKDGKIRLILGAILAAYGLYDHSMIMTILGAAVMASGYFRFCFLYHLLKKSTDTPKKKK